MTLKRIPAPSGESSGREWYAILDDYGETDEDRTVATVCMMPRGKRVDWKATESYLAKADRENYLCRETIRGIFKAKEAKA